MPRLFIGVELSAQTKQLLNKLIPELSSNIKDLKPVKQDNFHLTVKFLGDTQENKIETIESTLKKVAKIYRKFSITLDTPGCFPKANKATVIWIGVRYGSSELIDLANEIDAAFANIGFAAEKKSYRPHITIARIKTPTAVNDVLYNIDDSGIYGRVINVSALTIFKSTLSPKGAIYEVIKKIPLNL